MLNMSNQEIHTKKACKLESNFYRMFHLYINYNSCNSTNKHWTDIEVGTGDVIEFVFSFKIQSGWLKITVFVVTFRG